jgi:hypothetical protein
MSTILGYVLFLEFDVAFLGSVEESRQRCFCFCYSYRGMKLQHHWYFKYSSRIKTACLYFKYSSLLNQLPIRVIKMSWISLKTTEFSLVFFFSLTNLYCKLVATLFQQLVIMEDVFALLVSSMLASCYKVVELNVLVTSCSDNLLSFCNSTTCQQVLSDNLVASSW